MRSSVPSMGRRVEGSTSATTTAFKRVSPSSRTTVRDRCNGMPKSSRHCTMLRRNPEENGMISYTPSTLIPESDMRRAMISPMSPEPSTTAVDPGTSPCKFMKFCAQPAV